MTPQEKAKELFDLYCYLIRTEETSEGYFTNIIIAKNCALFVVNEILNNFGNLTDGKQFYTAYNTIQFYEKVKQELEKL